MHVYSVQLKIPTDPTDLFQVDHASRKDEFEQPPGVANPLRDNRCGDPSVRYWPHAALGILLTVPNTDLAGGVGCSSSSCARNARRCLVWLR